jgi:hypothetical protein
MLIPSISNTAGGVRGCTGHTLKILAYLNSSSVVPYSPKFLVWCPLSMPAVRIGWIPVCCISLPVTMNEKPLKRQFLSPLEGIVSDKCDIKLVKKNWRLIH